MILDMSKPLEYDIAAAMRGPDRSGTGCVYLKDLTTAVVRHFVGVDPKVGAVFSPEEAKSVWEGLTGPVRREVKSAWSCHSHFRWHMRDALLALQVQPAQAYLQWLQDTLEGEG